MVYSDQFPSLIFSQIFLILSTSTAFFLTLESKQENKETNKNKQNIQRQSMRNTFTTQIHTHKTIKTQN